MPKLSFLYKEQRVDGLSCCKEARATKFKEVVSLSFLRTRVPKLILSPTTSAKENGTKQRTPSDTVADVNKIVEEEGDDGEKLKEKHSAF